MNEPCQSSDLLSASTLITPAGGRSAKLHSVVGLTDGTNAATIVVYDNKAAAASGIILAKLIVPGANSKGELIFNCPMNAANGLYVTISGTGANAIIGYVMQ